jgi:hypothetical protein
MHLNNILISDLEELTEECARQLGMPEEDLLHLMATLAAIMQDQQFVQQTLTINDIVNKIAADN